jgi:hypothetical protein
MSVSNTKPNTVSNTVANAYTAGPLKPAGDHIYLPMSSGVHEPENLSDIGVVNGSFIYWTADDPDGWSVSETAPNSEITQSGNACRLLSDGTYCAIIQTILTIGKQYRIRFEITEANGGSISINNGVVGVFSAVGSYEVVFTAVATDLNIKRSTTPLDIVITNITITENLVTNGDFTAWVDPNTPTSWTKVGTHDVNNYVFDATNKCQIVSDGTFVGISQNVVTVGKKYRATIEITGFVSGGIQIFNGGTFLATLSTVDTHTFTFTGTATDFNIRRRTGIGNVDVTFTNVSVEEISARTLDVSGYGHHFLLGDGSTVATFPAKIAGDGYLLDATDDRLYNATDLIGATDFTFGMVARIDSDGGGGSGRLIDNSQLLAFTSTGRVRVSSDGGGTSVSTPLNSFAYGDIITVIVTRSSSTVSIYINGFKSATGSAGVPAVGSATYIGNNGAATRGLDGVVYNHVKVGVSYDEYAVKDLHQRLLADADIRG